MKVNSTFFHLNIGHILTIITMISGFFLFSIRQESRLTSMETDIKWTVKLLTEHLTETRKPIVQVESNWKEVYRER